MLTFIKKIRIMETVLNAALMDAGNYKQELISYLYR